MILGLSRTLLVAGLLMSAGAAWAQEEGEEDGQAPIASPPAPVQAPGWQTWTWNRTCFAFLAPMSQSVAALDEEGAYIAIKHMPAEETFDSVAIVSGQGETSANVGRIDIDGQIFNLLPYQGAGFVSTGDREERLLQALVAGSEARVTWTSDQGMIVQNYRLEGLVLAKKVIDVGCRDEDPAS